MEIDDEIYNDIWNSDIVINWTKKLTTQILWNRKEYYLNICK